MVITIDKKKVKQAVAIEYDPNDLASKIEWLITHEPERKEMGQKARVFAASRKQDVVMGQWEKLYTGLVK